jgi:poly(glycerol-phosphate) alpha-glucosyltransferase
MLTSCVSRRAGGIFGVVRRLAQSLQARGDLALAVLSLEDEYDAADLPAWRPLTPQAFPVRGPRAFGYSPGLARALGDLKPDLVHTHGLWMYPSWACRGWAGKTGRPYVITPHGMLDPWALRNSRWKKLLAGWLYQNAHLRRASCIHALCESEYRSIRQYGLRSPVCIIPNGMDLPPDGDRGPGSQDRKGKLLLYLGRLHPKKGLPNLLDAWAHLRRNLSSAREWTLVIAGWDQSDHEAALQNQARDLGLAFTCRDAPAQARGFERPVAQQEPSARGREQSSSPLPPAPSSLLFFGPAFNLDKETLLRSADAFILPSFSEGLPMTILEAWAYGLPVVMTPECNLPEGFAVNAAIRIETNPTSIANGLAQLFSMSVVERREMGGHGRRLIEERFNWPKVAAEMKATYEWVLGGGVPPDCLRRE